jgi:hypothetical protein
MPNKKRVKAFSKKAVIYFVTLSTILWSIGLPFLFSPVAQAAAPKITLVRYINPTTFQVRFDQAMNESTIVAASFTLHTAATDTETISNVSTATAEGITTATVTASGAKISPTYTDWVRVACGTEANAPKNAGDEANSDCNNIGLVMDPGEIVISEVQISGGTDETAKNEFIELYNKTNSNIDLNGWKLKFADATGAETELVADLDGTNAGADILANGGYYLIANAAYAGINPAANITYQATNDIPYRATILLYNDQNKVVDMVGFGDNSANPSVLRESQQITMGAELASGQSIERKAAPDSTSPSMAVGGTQGSWGNGFDSNNNDYDFVMRTSPQPQNASSPAETPGGGQYQNQPPTINHMPISQVPENTEISVFANMMDAETPPASLVANLIYSKNSGNSWTTLTGQYIPGNPEPFKFIIPATEVGSGTGVAFIYYLKVTDGNNASACMWNMGFGVCGSDDATAKAGAWSVTRVSTTGWTNSIKGRIVIFNTTTGINNAAVTLRGAGLTFNTITSPDQTVSPAVDGVFSFTNLPAGIFRIEASAPGYMPGWLDGVPSKATGAAYTDWTLGLSTGSTGGQGGDISAPMVIWSAPMEGMMGAPTKIDIPATGNIEAPILIGFSKDMDSATITSSNIKLKKVSADGTLTDVTVSVVYQPQNGSVTLTDRSNRSVGAADFGPDRKAILYTADDLTTNSQYVIDISPNVKDSAQNALQGNKPGGGHTIIFNTGGDFSGFSGDQMATAFNNFTAGAAGAGQYSPPYVQGSTPSNGAKNVPTNAKITISFSQPMDSVGINASNSAGTYVKLYDTNYNNSGSGQYITLNSVVLDTNTKQTATITVGGSGLVASHHYAIRVLGGTRSATGMTMAMPGQESTTMYQADFDTGAGADTGAPTVVGTTLQTYPPASSCSLNLCVTGVPINVGVIGVSFSKDMDFSTINTSNITLKSGTTNVTLSIVYDPMSRSAKIAPSSVLYTVTNYLLTIGTGVKAMNGVALASAYTVSFTTSSTVDTCVDPDTSCRPTVQYANADDYRMSITFSEPMNSAKATDTNNWSASVLNPANYVLYTDDGPPPSGHTALYFGNNNLSTATTAETGGPLTFKYDGVYNTVIIEGLRLMDPSLIVKGGFRVWVKNVKDLSGNLIIDSTKPANANDFGANSAGGGIMNSKDTFGMIGPGGGGMSGPPSTAMLSGGTMEVTAFGGKDPSMMGFKPINVWPMNMLAGQESLYMIDIPLSQAIPASGQIVLTFPIGFDVTNATDADPNKQWAHKDLNGPGTGTVTISSISANATARTVTITLAAATQANDFLHLEIDRIKNTTQATDGDMATGVTMGSGYQVDILTKTSATGGRTLETLKSMPFFIKKGGASTDKLTGTITFKNAAGNNTAVSIDNLAIFLGSPMTGPMKALVSLNNEATKTYTFSNLPTGMFMIGTEPLVTATSGQEGVDFFVDLNPMPQSINIVSGTNTKDIVFQAQDNTTKPQLTVYITGTFASEKIDIFAGGPSGFTVKTVTLNGTFTNAAPSTQTIFLPSTGTYMVGMGPAMPRGPQQSGPPPMPSWMPPKSIEVSASGTGPNWTWKDEDGTAAGDLNATDGKITLGVTSANQTISGHVYAPTGTTGIQNAEVFAYSPMGGIGSHATSDANGAFSLKVTEGSYKIGAFIPGMPPSPEMAVEVKTVGGTTTIYANGTATTDLILRVQNPQSMYTISGTVTDGTNVIKDASVYARRTDGPGNVGTKTDSTGKYILYVQAGIWQIGVFLPQYGNLAEQTVTVSTESKTNIDFAPTTGQAFYTIKERVCKDTAAPTGSCTADDTPISNANVVFKGTNYSNHAFTDTNGIFSIKVPAGTYDVEAWSPTIGKLPSLSAVSVTTGSNYDGVADIPTSDSKTITLNFKDSTGASVTLDKVYVQMDKLGEKNVSNEVNREKVSSITFDVLTGTNYQYALDIDIPGVSDNLLTVSSSTDGVVTAQDIIAGGNPEMYKVKVENNVTLDVTVPTLYTVTGTAQDNSGNPLPDTVINIKKPGGSDVALTAKTDSSGNYSVKLPASGSTPYLFQIDKAGYIDTSISVPVTASTTQNLDGVKTTLTISGQIKIGSSGVDGAKVYAKQLGGGFASAETDTQGNYTLPVTAGDWKISATSDGYQEKVYQNSAGQNLVVTMTDSNQTGINITLDTPKTGLAGLTNKDITPSSGGTFTDVNASLEIAASPNAIAASQATYQMEDYEVANVTSTPTAKTIGGEAIEIKSYEPSGSSMVPKNTFSDDITIEKKYTKSELVSAGIDTFAEADAVKMSYFDESASNWQPVPTNVTYLDSNGAPVIPTSNLSNVSYVVYAGISDHMTVYSPTNPTPDGLAPAAPTGLTATAGTSQVALTWTAPTTNADDTTLTDLLGYEIYRSTSETGTYIQVNTTDVLTTSYTDTTVTNGVTYYYKVTAADTGGIESVMSSVSNAATPTAPPSGGAVILPTAPVEKEVEKVVEKAPEKVVEKPVSQMTIAELQAEIARITALIAQLQAQLAELLAIPEIPAGYKFEKTLKYGQTSDDVKYLQIFLNSDPETQLASEGPGSPGQETNYFGSLTRKAVIKFQEKYATEVLAPWGLTKGTGIVGEKTRAKINQLLGR